MRVLIVRHGYYPRDPRVRREARSLVGGGYQVEVVCLRGPDEEPQEEAAGVRVTRLPIAHRRAGTVRYLAEYSAFFVLAATLVTLRSLRRRYDLVQVHSMPDVLVFVALVPKLLGTPVLLDLHEVMPELYASKFGVGLDHPMARVLANLERMAIRFADACLAVSKPCLERYIRRGASRDKFTVTMNAADPEVFELRTAADRGDSAVGPQPLRLVSHGTLVERYGYDTILRALSSIPSAHLHLLGDGEYRPELEDLAAALEVSKRVTFAGFVPQTQIADRIAAGDIGVVANRRDVFTDLVVPTKLLEYVALGIPAVASRTPAIERCFREGEVAYFRAGDAHDLARVLRELAADPERRRAQADRAWQRYTGEMSWPTMAERYLDLVGGLTSRAREANGDA